MLLLAHLGIGLKLAQPFAGGIPLRSRRRVGQPDSPAPSQTAGGGLPVRWILLGTVLPDLIDKPLYYGLSAATGLRGPELGLVSCTRTFGHTGILLLALTLFAYLRHSRAFAAVALGMATHLFLDSVSERFIFNEAIRSGEELSSFLALVFPFQGWRFGSMPFHDFREHAFTYASPVTLWLEGAGTALLGWEYWKLTYLRELREGTRVRRLLRRRGRRR